MAIKRFFLRTSRFQSSSFPSRLGDERFQSEHRLYDLSAPPPILSGGYDFAVRELPSIPSKCVPLRLGGETGHRGQRGYRHYLRIELGICSIVARSPARSWRGHARCRKSNALLNGPGVSVIFLRTRSFGDGVLHNSPSVRRYSDPLASSNFAVSSMANFSASSISSKCVPLLSRLDYLVAPSLVVLDG